MRIIFVAWGTGIAGGVRAIFKVADGLLDKGYKVSILALGGEHSWIDLRTPIYYVPLPNRLRTFFTIYRILRGRFREKYTALSIEGFSKKLGFHADLIRLLAEKLPEADAYIATWFPTALSVWLGASENSRRLFFMQDFLELVEEAGGEYGLRLFDVTLRLPFIFIANSNFTKELILSKNPVAKIYVSGVGVDADVFYPRKSRIIDSRGKPIIMAIIRESKYKGSDIAIKALNLINRRIPIHAVFVDSNHVLRKIFATIKPEFEYSIFNYVSDEFLAKLYSSSDIFIFTSYKESFGLPLLSLLGRLLRFRVVVKMDWDGVIRGSHVKRLVRGLSLALFSRFADLMIVESYEALLNAVRSVPSLYSKLRVVYNGYCDELLKPVNVPREPIVLTVARVEPVKGIHDLITAFAKMASKYPQWRLRIVGPMTDKEYFSKLVNLVNELGLSGRVDFVGPISDSHLVEEYSRASIFVLPSYMEGSSIARVEAMAFGLPVITTETGGSEVVKSVGIIIKPGDVDGLARALDVLMGNVALRARLSIMSLERAKLLTWKKTCKRILELAFSRN